MKILVTVIPAEREGKLFAANRTAGKPFNLLSEFISDSLENWTNLEETKSFELLTSASFLNNSGDILVSFFVSFAQQQKLSHILIQLIPTQIFSKNSDIVTLHFMINLFVSRILNQNRFIFSLTSSLHFNL